MFMTDLTQCGVFGSPPRNEKPQDLCFPSSPGPSSSIIRYPNDTAKRLQPLRSAKTAPRGPVLQRWKLLRQVGPPTVCTPTVEKLTLRAPVETPHVVRVPYPHLHILGRPEGN